MTAIQQQQAAKEPAAIPYIKKLTGAQGMPPELRRAHQENDRAVMAAYGFSTKMTESECVAELFKMYQELTK